jgi:hypothetical protein
MSLTTVICLSLSVGLGLSLLVLIDDGDKAVRERDWTEGREAPQECFPSHQAKQGVKWFFVVWGVLSLLLLLLVQYVIYPVHTPGDLLSVFLTRYVPAWVLIAIYWAVGLMRFLEQPLWRLPAEIAAIGGVVFLAIEGIGQVIRWGVRLAGGAAQLTVFVLLGLPLALFALTLALWIVVSPILGLTHLARFVRGKLRKRPHAGEGAGPPSIPKA